jgi:uncharacterized membrane protein YccC
MRPPHGVRVALACIVLALFVVLMDWPWWSALIVLLGPQALVLGLGSLPRREDPHA